MGSEYVEYLSIALTIFFRKKYRLRLKWAKYSNEGIVKKATDQAQRNKKKGQYKEKDKTHLNKKKQNKTNDYP